MSAKKYFLVTALSAVIILPVFSADLSASGGFVASLQGSAVFTGYNDVALPGDSGTMISYSSDLDSPVVFSPRIEAGYEFAFPFYAGIMASTLRLEADGTLKKNVNFDDKTFASGTDVKATYRFDSYRATVRYYFIDNGNLKMGAGFTGKIRDANITLEGGGQKGSLENTGFVPIINLYLRWSFTPEFSLLVYGDGAWSPCGRAEDFFAGLLYGINDNVSLMAGYRVLEGGADNDTVYTFSLFHYAVAGLELRF